jgi:transcriptional regulator with XRE-family HTH domain
MGNFLVIVRAATTHARTDTDVLSTFVCRVGGIGLTNTAKEQQSLGQTINELRKKKNITVNRLCTYCGISKATYVRIINDKTEIRLPVLIKMMSVLRISYRELDRTFIDILTVPVQLIDEVEDTIYVCSESRDQLAPEFYALAEAVHTSALAAHNEGIKEIDLLCRAADAYAHGETDKSAQMATQLIQRLDAYGDWTAFEQSIAIDAMPYLSYAQTITVVARIRRTIEHESTTWPNQVAYGQKMNQMHIFLLMAALETQQRIPLRNAITTITKFCAPGANLCSRLIRELAYITSLHLQGEESAAMADAIKADQTLEFLGKLDRPEDKSLVGTTLHQCLNAIESTPWNKI